MIFSKPSRRKGPPYGSGLEWNHLPLACVKRVYVCRLAQVCLHQEQNIKRTGGEPTQFSGSKQPLRCVVTVGLFSSRNRRALCFTLLNSLWPWPPKPNVYCTVCFVVGCLKTNVSHAFLFQEWHFVNDPRDFWALPRHPWSVHSTGYSSSRNTRAVKHTVQHTKITGLHPRPRGKVFRGNFW